MQNQTAEQFVKTISNLSAPLQEAIEALNNAACRVGNCTNIPELSEEVNAVFNAAAKEILDTYVTYNKVIVTFDAFYQNTVAMVTTLNGTVVDIRDAVTTDLYSAVTAALFWFWQGSKEDQVRMFRLSDLPK